MGREGRAREKGRLKTSSGVEQQQGGRRKRHGEQNNMEAAAEESSSCEQAGKSSMKQAEQSVAENNQKLYVPVLILQLYL